MIPSVLTVLTKKTPVGFFVFVFFVFLCFCVFVLIGSAARSEDLNDEQIGRVGRREDVAVSALAEGVQEIVMDATSRGLVRAENLDAMVVPVAVPANVATEVL